MEAYDPPPRDLSKSQVAARVQLANLVKGRRAQVRDAFEPGDKIRFRADIAFRHRGQEAVFEELKPCGLNLMWDVVWYRLDNGVRAYLGTRKFLDYVEQPGG